MSYADISYRVFGGISRIFKPYFLDIKDDMRKASITYTIEEYVSIALFTAALTFVVEVAIFSFSLGLFLDPLASVIASLILSIGISGFLFFMFYTYPVAVAKSKSNKIKKVLPFAVSYMATIASSKSPPITLFKTISQFKEYGDVAEESKSIANSVEVFGLTMSAAIKKQAKATSSKEFRELLWGINTVIMAGGDLEGYLRGKGNEMMADYRRRIRKFSQDLSLYVEIYLTLIITGAIFFIVLSSVIATLSAGLETVVMQTFIVFILLPLISIGFIVMIKSMSPVEA